MPKASTFGALIASQVIDSDSVPLITNAGDNKRIPISEMRDVVGLGWGLTINAARFPGIDDEEKITAAIVYAAGISAPRVFVPTSMLPYDATAVTFNTVVQMVREGGNFDNYDWRAYGASGNDSNDDFDAIDAARAGAVAAGGVLYGPPGIYQFSQNLDFSGIPAIKGAGRLETILKPTSAITSLLTCINLGSDQSMEDLMVDGSLTTADVIGVHMGEAFCTDIRLLRCAVLNFDSSNAVGLRVDNVVQGLVQSCLIGSNFVDVDIIGDLGSLPTAVKFTDCNIRAAVIGLRLRAGYMLTFLGCTFEANSQDGVRASGTVALSLIHFIDCWFEANYSSNPSFFGITLDGTTGTLNGVRFTHCYYNGSGGTEKALNMINVTNYVMDGLHVYPRTGNIQLDGTSAGEVHNWPGTAGVMLDTIDDNTPAGSLWSNRNEINAMGTAWTDWTPTYGGSGSMTYTSVTTTKARYKMLGKTLSVMLNVMGTTGGTPNIGITVSMPGSLTALDANLFVPCLLSQDGGTTYQIGTVQPSSSGLMTVFLQNFGAWGAGAGRQILASFTFELA